MSRRNNISNIPIEEKTNKGKEMRTENKKIIKVLKGNIEVTKYKLRSDEILETQNKLYYPIKNYRDPSLGNIRTLNYYCNKHETEEKIEYYLIGQMEAVNKHYVKYHPQKIFELKNITGRKELNLSKCRILISQLEKCSGDINKDFHWEFKENIDKINF